MRSKRRGGNRRILSLQGRNIRQQMNGIELLGELPNSIASMVFFDPQYRGVLDKQKYGNEGERQKERAKLAQMSTDDIVYFIEEIERTLKASGHLMLWMDKFTIASAEHKRWLRRAPLLATVDLLSWNKLTFGMGRRLRCSTEYLLILQKLPTRASGIWLDHGMRDSWSEMHDRAIHPHAKPIVATERLIRAATKRGDLVIDPCAGGYGVLEACRASGREFIGCDLI